MSVSAAAVVVFELVVVVEVENVDVTVAKTVNIGAVTTVVYVFAVKPKLYQLADAGL